MTFEKWAYDTGYKVGLSIDRIDSNRDYCPKNCRWTTYSENCKWHGGARCLEVNGIKDTIQGWAKRLEIGSSRLSERYAKDPQEALDYIAFCLENPDRVMKYVHEHVFVIDGIKDSAKGWSIRLGRSAGYVTKLINRYGYDETCRIIEFEYHNPGQQTDRPSKRKTQVEENIGKSFKYYTIIGYEGKVGHNHYYLCRCNDCGKEKTLTMGNLKSLKNDHCKHNLND